MNKKDTAYSNREVDYLDSKDDEITYMSHTKAYTAYSDDDNDTKDIDHDLDDLLFDSPTAKYSDDPDPDARVATTKKNQGQDMSLTNPTSYDNADKSDDNKSDDESDDDGESGEDEELLEPFQPRRNRATGDNDDGDSDHNDSQKRVGSEIDNIEGEDDSLLRPGDHIFVWKSSGRFGMKTYQKHGIVLSLDPNGDDNISIVTFYHKNKKYYEPERRTSLSFFQKKNTNEEQDSWEQYKNEGKTDNASLLGLEKDSNHENTGHGSGFASSSSQPNQKFTPTVRVESLIAFTANSKGGIQKVKYRVSLAKRLLSRGGTVTCCSPDEQALVLARVKYLLESSGRIPEFHMMAANGECAAVWCRMGRWCTLQGSSILHILFVGQAGGAAVGGVVASNVMLWAPMPGFWGSVGYIWFVPATVAYPILVPFLIGFGLASLVPLEALRRFRKKWAEISSEMNKSFWANTDPAVRECFFSQTVSADDDWMKKFFGNSPVGGGKARGEQDDELEEDKGQYMPLGNLDTAEYCETTKNTTTMTEKSDISSFNSSTGTSADENEDEMMKRVSAEYGITGLKSSQKDLEQEWKFDSTEETKWSTMSFGDSGAGGRKNKVDNERNMYVYEDETKRPLTNDTS